MKTGIITLYESQNYGALLQAFALETFLKECNAEPVFIRLPFPRLKNYWKMIKTKNIPLAIFRIFQEIKYIKSRTLINIGSTNSINERYDAVFVGSDTLWDVQNNSYPHFEQFLGFGINADKVIAYAPSCNSTMVDEFKNEYGNKATFERFASISVRDKKTAELVKKINEQDVDIVVDPTFLIDFEKYPVQSIKKKEKYALIYSYGFSKDQVKEIQEYCKKRSLKTVSVGIWNPWCDENVTATLPEFLGYIRGAECMITTTFHGTIFAMLSQVKYAVYAGNNYKVLDILSKTGNQHHNACEYELEGVLANIDQIKFSADFCEMVDVSQKYIINHLQ